MEDNDYPVLHISNVALPKNAPGGKIYLTATMGKSGSETIKDLVIASLQKDKVESVSLDLYVNVSQQITLGVSGAQGAELHISGFFEPQREGEDDEGMFMDGEEVDEEEESDEEEEVSGPSSKKLNQSLKQAQANAKKNVIATAGDDEDEDDEDDYDDEDLEDDEEEEDESEEEKPVAKKPQQAAAAPAKPVQ